MSRALIDRALAALLRALAAGDAGPFRLAEAITTSWASATFEGARHVVALELEGADAVARAARLRRALPEMEFVLPAHLVADIVALPGEDATLCFEALILDAA